MPSFQLDELRESPFPTELTEKFPRKIQNLLKNAWTTLLDTTLRMSPTEMSLPNDDKN